MRAPRDRHSLFDAYYQTIYEREIAKGRAIGDLLEQQRSNVNWLHDQVGLLLQRRAEQAGDAEALLPSQELHELAVWRLRKQGHTDPDADRVAAGLVKAATDRLVLLVPKAQGAVGFEVRSLQEFMAARALVADDDPTVLRRLEQLAPSALTQLQFPPDGRMRGLADTLREACQADPQIRTLVDQALEQALTGSTATAATAMAILARWEQGTGGFAMTARQRLARLVGELDQRQQRRLAPLAWLYPDGPLDALWIAADRNRKARTHTLANLVRPHLPTGNLDSVTEKAVAQLLSRLARVRLVPQAQPALYDVVSDGVFDDGGALSDPDVREVIAPAVEELARQNWQSGGALRGVLANWLARRLVSSALTFFLTLYTYQSEMYFTARWRVLLPA